MRCNIKRHKILGRWGAALMLAAVMWGAYAAPASALDLSPANYFKLTYEPVTFDKTEITAGETFHAVFKGKASCTKTLPFSPSQATIELRIVASHDAGGDLLTLNESYVISIDPFPGKAGETFDINQTIPLIMPANAAPGEYTVTGQFIEAKVKLLFIWQGITGAFPKEYSMGTVKVIDPEASAPPVETPPTPAPEPLPASEPTSPATPNPEPAATPQPAPEQPASASSWWVVLLLVIIIGAAIAGITLLVRRRK